MSSRFILAAISLTIGIILTSCSDRAGSSTNEITNSVESAANASEKDVKNTLSYSSLSISDTSLSNIPSSEKDNLIYAENNEIALTEDKAKEMVIKILENAFICNQLAQVPFSTVQGVSEQDGYSPVKYDLQPP